jgi:putative cell wall-binding protein
VVRVDLASFQRAGKAVFADGENTPEWASAIDPKGEFAYFGTRTSPGWIVKVALSAGGPDGTYRVSGSSRFETAAEIALDRFVPGQVDVAYLATGTNFPDALAGGPLATVTNGPILLAQRDELPADTHAALAALQPGRVVALGGTQVVSDAVLNQAAAAAGGATTDRLWGPNRYATAVAIAAAMPATGTVYVTTGENFPDALAGGAATGGSPILLVTPTALPAPTREAIASMRPDRVVALGGTNAVSDTVLAEAAQAAGGAVTSRLTGNDRFATAVAIAKVLPTPDTVYVATGVAFPDALAGGPAAAGEGAPTLLVTRDDVPDVVTAYLESLPGLRRVVVLGGTLAVSGEVMTELQSHTG